MSKYQLSLFGESDPIPQTPIDYLKAQPQPSADCPVVVSYGGGRNSTALLILCQRLGIKVDLILFADTGGEIPATYEFIELFSDWLVRNGMPPVTVVRRVEVEPTKNRKVWQAAKQNFNFGIKYLNNLYWIQYLIWWVSITGHKYRTLEENCLVTNTLPSKAYGNSSCSLAWKVEPQDKFVKTWQPANNAWAIGLKVRKLIGYHSKELSRLIDKKTSQLRDLEDKHYIYEYPLITNNIDDAACQMLIVSAGLPIPPKSSCFFCPNRKIGEITNLPEDLRLRGELIESVAKAGIHNKDNTSVKGLGRKFAWSNLAMLTPIERTLIEMQQESRQCHCVD